MSRLRICERLPKIESLASLSSLIAAELRASAVTASWPSTEFVPLGPMDFYKVKLNGGETLPDELLEVGQAIIDIRSALDNFESTNDQKYMKDAVAKIKSWAAVVKNMAGNPVYKENETNASCFKKARNEMKNLFERAKRVKAGDSGESKPSATEAAETTESPSVPRRSATEDKALKAQREVEAAQRRKEVEAMKREQEDADGEAKISDKQLESQIASTIRKAGTGKFPRGKDIWSQILNDLDEKGPDPNNTSEDYTLIFCGDKNSGKTTLANKILEKVEAFQPSTAMEFSYARRVKKFTTNQARDVLNTWEIAGGNSLTPLFDVAMTVNVIASSLVVIVVDLSKPAGLIDNLVAWLDTVRKTVDECSRQLRIRFEAKYDKMVKKSTGVFGDHADRKLIRPIGIPVIIVGSKYDQFQDMETSSRKVACKTLRYIALVNGCSLVFVTKEEEALVTRFRGLSTYYLFHTRPTKTVSTEYTKPLMIPAGLDTVESIGQPPSDSSSSSLTGSQAGSLGMRIWKEAWNETFPQMEDKKKTSSLDDSARFVEPLIDSLRSEKDQQLERYQRENQVRIRSSQTFSNGVGAASTPQSQYERAMSKQSLLGRR
ncbi:cytoplasmic dynein 2 light intermediate chain 1-like [Planoprotostelium fungivorum]|uniref:Cytoplasmic dynein 2 light intermediate chain 1 n=1 Tax=Planoprotostelium fungivorum TaxID=1890364 RepID=A0A2P6N9B7_9EUKA|nr:cytoplasmic dynein 2 light intermediate chain 1-like [Planoprotostelium fungivorum]